MPCIPFGATVDLLGGRMTIAEESTAPSVGAVISLSWQSCRDAATKMPFTFITAWIICFLLPLAQSVGTAQLASELEYSHSNFFMRLTVRGGVFLLAVIVVVAYDVVFASVAITVHRFILLGEEKSGIFALALKRTWRFVGWLLFFDVLIAICHLPIDFSEANASRYNLFYILFLIGLLIVGGRSMTLFPAVAIDVPSSRWQERIERSWQQTSGRLALIVFSYIGSVIPIALIIFAALSIPTISFLLSGNLDGAWSPFNLMADFTGAFADVATTAAAAAVASWIYKSARNDSKIAAGETA